MRKISLLWWRGWNYPQNMVTVFNLKVQHLLHICILLVKTAMGIYTMAGKCWTLKIQPTSCFQVICSMFLVNIRWIAFQSWLYVDILRMYSIVHISWYIFQSRYLKIFRIHSWTVAANRISSKMKRIQEKSFPCPIYSPVPSNYCSHMTMMSYPLPLTP